MSFNILINSINLTGREFKIIGFFLVITISLCIAAKLSKEAVAIFILRTPSEIAL